MYSHVSGPQLLRFSQTPNPCLHRVCLSSIKGFSNQDLFEFLSEITSTLTTLTIRDCHISRPIREEYALDAIVHKLSAIQRITSGGDCVSSLAIARKAAQGQLSGCIWIENAPLVDCGDIVDALKLTGWGEVSVDFGRFIGGSGEVLKGQATRVAKARGISFMLHQPLRQAIF